MVNARVNNIVARPMLVMAWGFMASCSMLAGCGSSGPDKPTLTSLDHLISNGRLAEAEEMLRKTLKDDAGDYEARAALAKVLCLEGDAELAKLGFFDRSAAGRNGRGTITDPRYEPARKLYESALAEAREALKKDPKNARIRGTLGLALHRTGDSKGAVDELKAALKDDPESAEVNNTLGLIAYEEGRTGEALSYYQTALALDNTMPETCYNLGVLYQDEFARNGRKDARDTAVRYFELYLRYNRGARDAEIEKTIKELEGQDRSGGAGASGPGAGRDEKEQ